MCVGLRWQTVTYAHALIRIKLHYNMLPKVKWQLVHFYALSITSDKISLQGPVEKD